MKRMFTPKLIGAIAAILVFAAPGTLSGKRPEHPYRYSDVDIPISLEAGTVRTPEFVAHAYWYWILVQVEKPLPAQQMRCMMGVTLGPLDAAKCKAYEHSYEQLVSADWTVWSDGKIVDSGSSETQRNAANFTSKNIFKFIGYFGAYAGKKYVLEVKFMKNGTPLNIANPHLIVVKQGYE